MHVIDEIASGENRFAHRRSIISVILRKLLFENKQCALVTTSSLIVMPIVPLFGTPPGRDCDNRLSTDDKNVKSACYGRIVRPTYSSRKQKQNTNKCYAMQFVFVTKRHERYSSKTLLDVESSSLDCLLVKQTNIFLLVKQ